MTNQTRSVAWKNTHIAAEWGRHGRLEDNTQYTRDQKAAVIRRRAASPEKVAQDRRVLKYEGRGNMCGSCYMARSVTGECGCT